MKFKVFALAAIFVVATVAPANAGGRDSARINAKGTSAIAARSVTSSDVAPISSSTRFTLKASIPGLNGCC